jgi:SAM-dependent methyltransferase
VRPADGPSAADLVRTSLRVGLHGLLHARLAEAFWRLWMPLDIDRVHELPWAGRHVVAARPRRVLDISSPKVLACWLVHSTGAQVVATDLWREEIDAWSRLVPNADRGRLKLDVADATSLQYDDAAFDAVFSVSVIEHIPGEGDSTMMSELERTLAPGGVAVLTFPFRSTYAEEFVEHDLYGSRYDGTPIFFYRHYDAEALQRRLLGPTHLEVFERVVWTKGTLRESADAAHRIVPARLGLGRALGPVMVPLARRTMRLGDEAHLATDNVMGLALRKPR